LLTELVNPTRGLTVIKFKDDDHLLFAHFTQPGQDVVLATAGGRLLRFDVNDEQLPVMGRTAVASVAAPKQEQLVGCVTLGKLDDNLLLVSQLGYKRMVSCDGLIAVILALRRCTLLPSQTPWLVWKFQRQLRWCL